MPSRRPSWASRTRPSSAKVPCRPRLRADVAVSVTGIAGPDGGTEEKPVGLVYVHAESPEASRGIEFSFPGDRDSVRTRSAVVALHLVRRLLSQNRDRE